MLHNGGLRHDFGLRRRLLDRLGHKLFNRFRNRRDGRRGLFYYLMVGGLLSLDRGGLLAGWFALLDRSDLRRLLSWLRCWLLNLLRYRLLNLLWCRFLSRLRWRFRSG